MSLEKVNFDEAKQSQLPFVEILLNMGYTYVSSEEALRQRGDTSNFILADIGADNVTAEQPAPVAPDRWWRPDQPPRAPGSTRS